MKKVVRSVEDLLKHMREGQKELSLQTDRTLSLRNMQSIASALKHNNTLAELKFECPIGDGVQHIADALKSNTTLTSLDLGESNIPDDATKAIADVLKNNNTTLTYLGIGAWDIGNNGVEYIADALKVNTTLTSLYLRPCNGDNVQHIADALRNNTTLTSLDLGNCNIGSGVQYIADALQKNTTLTTLKLNACSIGSDIYSNDLQHIANILKTNKTLTFLDLSSNSVYSGSMIADALKENTTLTTLKLVNCGLNVRNAKDIADALKGNTALTTLELGNNTINALGLGDNNIGADGAQHIADALRNNTTLTTLGLGNSNIGADGAQFIADLLKENTTLISVNFHGNNIGDGLEKSIEDSLRRNKDRSLIDPPVNNVSDDRAKLSTADDKHANVTPFTDETTDQPSAVLPQHSGLNSATVGDSQNKDDFDEDINSLLESLGFSFNNETTQAAPTTLPQLPSQRLAVDSSLGNSQVEDTVKTNISSGSKDVNVEHVPSVTTNQTSVQPISEVKYKVENTEGKTGGEATNSGDNKPKPEGDQVDLNREKRLSSFIELLVGCNTNGQADGFSGRIKSEKLPDIEKVRKTFKTALNNELSKYNFWDIEPKEQEKLASKVILQINKSGVFTKGNVEFSYLGFGDPIKSLVEFVKAAIFAVCGDKTMWNDWMAGRTQMKILQPEAVGNELSDKEDIFKEVFEKIAEKSKQQNSR